MGLTGSSHESATLHDYLGVVRRRKWIILQAVVIVPILAVFLATRQEPLYEATADVLINTRDVSGSLTGIGSFTYQDPVRLAQTQAELAQSLEVAQNVVRTTNADISPAQFLEMASATPYADSDLIGLSVVDTSQSRAVKLATAYAQEFTKYRSALDTADLDEALAGVQDRLRTILDQKSPLYQGLLNREQQLQELKALQAQPLTLVRPATAASQVAPRPFRNGFLGLLLGLVLGFGLAFLREALDTRVRTAEEVAEALDLPLLARLPTPPRRLAAKDRLVMLGMPRSKEAEAFRMLRTNLEFTNLERGARVIMVTSAVESEGKSTTASNLALALARAGRHVALADLDLRRPYLDRFFGLRGAPGLTQVALGHVELDVALATVAITDSGDSAPAATGGVGANGGANGHGRVSGVLEVLPSGPIPPDAGEFVGTHAVAAIIQDLRERADFVIIDAPPLLNVGDAMALSSKVDGLILVTRLKVLRRGTLKELHRLLTTIPAQPLGFVVTGAEVEKGYGYEYGYGDYGRSSAPRTDQERVR